MNIIHAWILLVYVTGAPAPFYAGAFGSFECERLRITAITIPTVRDAQCLEVLTKESS